LAKGDGQQRFFTAPRHAMTRSIILALLLAPQVACGAVPRLFQQSDFTAASFAETVNHFVNLGEDAAVDELRGLVPDGKMDFQRKFNVNERIGWMCRVLFQAKSGSLRRPAFGALDLPHNTMPDKSWPLYPVALSGSTYFVLSQGYHGRGVPEDPKEYLEYCRQNGVFRKMPITVPTRAQALKDAAALRQSAAWQAIKWQDSGENWSYTINEKWVWKFIQKQAEDIR
jgi:hypothetical protein